MRRRGFYLPARSGTNRSPFFFAGRILDFDIEAAAAYAQVRAKARTAGYAVAAADGYIAAIARVYDFAAATHDTDATGHLVINPFQE